MDAPLLGMLYIVDVIVTDRETSETTKHNNYRKFKEEIETKRNDTLEEVAREFDKMKAFGDTAASFAQYVREMKSAKT
jgi:hypothetical protein